MILLKNFIVYIIHNIFLQLLILNEVKSQKFIKPDPRNGHTSTFIHDKLYILGGVTNRNNSSPKETFLYVDFSVSFNVNKINWHNLSSKNSIVPSHHLATTLAVNNTLFLFGGININSHEIMAPAYKFDIQSNLWKIQEINGIPGKQGAISIFDESTIYLFGGSPFTYNINDLFIIKSNDLTWKNANLTNSPFPRAQYGAVLLPNKYIIYMGGYNNGSIPLDQVYLYDIRNDFWTIKQTYGSIPSARYSFSRLDGNNIIIFGGQEDDKTIVENSLYVLNVNNFNWHIPKVTGKIPSSRTSHKAALIGKHMVITFGKGYNQEIEDDLLLLDISNNNEYAWTSYFALSPITNSKSLDQTDAQPDQPDTQSMQSNATNGSDVMTGLIIGAIINGILLIVGTFFLYKWYKNKRIRNNATLPNQINNQGQEIISIPENTELHT
ncbi:hypothetical protein RclHR1_03970008 [Rhizophagus clarus]|uniref:Galactose oxidase n=1 Tax=Rhizophagus clarus TaxID=94130 RepID=A0A2Z6RDT3_9GLOM|nr:hypothetical protein RclHR1_03970008 [Rhizophagus clarus]